MGHGEWGKWCMVNEENGGIGKKLAWKIEKNGHGE